MSGGAFGDDLAADLLRADETPARGHFVHIFPTFSVGGVQNRTIRIAKALRHKYRNTVIAFDSNFEAASGLEAGESFAFEAMTMVKAPFISVRNLLNARAALRRLRPDLLLTYNWGALEWALANSLAKPHRHIHFESGFGPDESAERQLWRRAKTRRLFLARSERVIVPSVVLRDLAIGKWRLPRDKVRHIPDGIDCRRFARAHDEMYAAALGLAEGMPVVGTVSTLRREKNLLRLIRVFAALPRALGAKLVIVGDGPERAALTQMAADLAVTDRVIFAGALADPERILARFDVFALTSDTEQMPNSVLEAMAAGLAVATTNVGDVTRMLAPENAGYIVPVADEAALAERIGHLLQDRELRARIGRANQARARQEYALETMVARYDALFSGHADPG